MITPMSVVVANIMLRQVTMLPAPVYVLQRFSHNFTKVSLLRPKLLQKVHIRVICRKVVGGGFGRSKLTFVKL